MKLVRMLLRRLAEPSTWRGLTLLLTVCGIALSPEQADAIMQAGLAVVGAIGLFLPDHIGARPQPEEAQGESVSDLIRRGRG